MKLIFETQVTPNVSKVVNQLIARNKSTNGKISVELLHDNDMDCFETEEHFIEKHKDVYDIYMVYQNWNRPLSLVAVE